MAKAKFPGKPPKTSQITRLRVSSNVPVGANDPSRLAAQKAAFGLKLFHQHFVEEDEDDDDFVGFERVGDCFEPRFQPKTSRQTEEDEVFPRACDGSSVMAFRTVSARDGVVDQLGQSVTATVDTHRERTFPVNQSRGPPCSNGAYPSETPKVRKHHDKVKASTHILPSESVSKPSLPAKRPVDGADVPRKKKKSREERHLYRKPGVDSSQPLQVPAGVENLDQGKIRMKREVERYAEIMTTEVADSKPIVHVEKKKKKHRKHRSPSSGDKEGKLRDKIQQLLRSQWESRLQLVDAKPDPVITPERTESRHSVSSSLSSSSSSSSEEDTRFFKRASSNSNSSSSSSSARKSKIILRKARLQLNHKLLKQLRHPSRLQKLVEPETSPSPVEPPKVAVPPASSSILRPAQLVLQTSPAQPVLQRPILPRPSTAKEPTKPAKTLPKPPPIKISQVQKTGETTVSNPLGCAFVMEPVDNKRLPGTVVCGVCGAVRRYSFILQARKFGTFSCEPCRKFISRTLLSRVPVKCVSGTGHCIHPPVLRWNSSCPPEDKPTGEVMTSRCKACWLKLALTGFKMREADHDDLRRLLPSSMQGSVPLAANRPDTLHWAPNRGQMVRMKSSTPPPGVSLPPPTNNEKAKTGKAAAPSQKTEHCAGSRTREKSGSAGTGGVSGCIPSTSEVQTTGPRVKHVCRSALPGRAQPRAAVEGAEADHPPGKHMDGICSCCSLPDVSSPLPVISDRGPHHSSKIPESSSKVSRSADRKNSLSSPAMPLTISQGERSRVTRHEDARVMSATNLSSRVGLMTPAVRAWQQQESGRNRLSQGRTAVKSAPRKGVLVPDLWERYDADRVWDQGFAICGSKNLSVTSPLCYLCGSAGRDELVSCASCCEPFHLFCVADSAPLPTSGRNVCDHWNKDTLVASESQRGGEDGVVATVVSATTEKPWICLNCVTCQVCQSSSGDRTVCSACSQAYHWSCLGPAHPSSHRKRRSKWTCFSCVSAKDKHCPLCLGRHDADQRQRLECDCCGFWVHAECEELSEEDFRLLSTSAEIQYVCRLCNPEKSWSSVLCRVASGLYQQVLSAFSNESTEELDAVGEKVARSMYKSCGEFCSDVRRLPIPSDLIESVLMSVMPCIFLPKQATLPAPPQTITIRAKVEYDAEADIRICALCHGRGEGPAGVEGRLLYCGNDLWAHINCALWSNEVFEEVDGALLNVLDALARSTSSRCTHCGTKGATVNCATRGCPIAFHFPCALQETEVTLLEGKRLVCRQHIKDPAHKNLAVHPPNFEVSRCVYVDLGTESKRIKAHSPSDIRVAIGSLAIMALGQLKTDVSGGSRLKPVGYESRRRFWSTKEPWKLIAYTLRTIYVPNETDGKDAETNVTVSHEEDDVIMAESGLNLAELDTQDDRELIHMVLEDANFEQELEGGPNAAVATSSPNPLRDSGFYSDGHSAGETSPSPAEDHALEAWLADPEHAVIFLDSALLASLDIDDDAVMSPRATSSASGEVRIQSGHYPQLPESNTPPKRSLRKRKLSYTQWKKMRRIQTRRVQSASRAKNLEAHAGSSSSILDWNGNDAEWNGSGGLVANIKVSPFSTAECANKSVEPRSDWQKNKKKKSDKGNILQLDGAGDSSETDSEQTSPIKLERDAAEGEEPVKCKRCRRSYRTIQSFNKHAETCVELLSSSSSGSEDESEEENIAPLQVKQEPMELDPVLPPPMGSFQLKQEPADTPEPSEQEQLEPIQVPIVNSSSRLQAVAPPPVVTPKVSSVHKARQRRQVRPNLNGIPPRPLAARTANPSQEIRLAVPTTTTMPTFQVTLQPPPPPVLYVTRPEFNPCGFISQPTLAPPQQHIIIMPPPTVESFGQPQLSASTVNLTSQPSASPMVQYLGAVPSNLLSALGIFGVTNYVPSMPTLQLHSQPVQLPWVESAVPNQIVILNPQQPVIPFNASCVPAQPTEAVERPAPCAVAPQPSVTTVDPVHVQQPEPTLADKTLPSQTAQSTESAGAAFAALVESCCNDNRQVCSPEPAKSVTEVTVEKSAEATVAESDASSVSDVRPPKPTYSYRSAMSGSCGKKASRLNGASVCDPSVVQQLKVVAHPSAPERATRTFHLKAVAGEPQDRVLSPAEETVSSSPIVPPSPLDITVDITSPKVDEVCDVFATPPASSEPPILPTDVEGEAPSWPEMIDSTPTQQPLPPLPPPPPTILQAPVVDNTKKKKEAHILYELVSDDGFYAQSESLSIVWQKLLDAVQDARLAFKMEPLHNGCVKSLNERNLHLTGLHHHALINLLEQLPNADQCPDYTFLYRTHRDRQSDEKITGSAYGCVRAAPYSGRVPYDMFSWLSSQYRPRPPVAPRTSAIASAAGVDQADGPGQPSRRPTNFDLLPMSVRFKHLRQTAKHSVGVYRSFIHGRGLFCKRDIESGEMVVEYAGQVIRSVLCDKREKEYEAKGMGCYMFRVDEQTVVDATVHGNAARFINHSCEPNCYSRIVDIHGKKHIIIFASRRIQRGEELTYDYKFPLEGPERKIKCNCGSARKCRKYMN